MNEPLVEALSSHACLVSVIGEHAGEGMDKIFERKKDDIGRIGKTFWVIRSPKANPAQVQEMCKNGTAYVIFVDPATKGGARPAVTNNHVSCFSIDRKEWCPLPDGISPVTGKIDSLTSALVLDMLTVVPTTEMLVLDLWSYADFQYQSMPLKLIQGCSTICAFRKDMTHHEDRLKSRIRNVIAIGKLADPYGVWVK
jgi:hypothetical protein